jgi:hypothetical protein
MDDNTVGTIIVVTKATTLAFRLKDSVSEGCLPTSMN